MRSIFEKVYKDGHTMQSIKDAVVAMANETVIEQMSTRQQEIMRNVGALPKLANEVKDLRRELERSERKGNNQSRRQSRLSLRYPNQQNKYFVYELVICTSLMYPFSNLIICVGNGI